jgi:hypothetical protein
MDSERTADTDEPTELDAEPLHDEDDFDVVSGNALSEDEESLVETARSSQSSATADLEELVRYVAGKLVQNAEDISVESELRAGTVYVSLRVPEDEMGRVIGREGRTAKAIRTLVSIAGSRHNVHARLDIDG